ncbi:MAG: ribose-5-phosphate isomerase RpiA [Planctomycetes bacterium]|nr:ribose-5-phosphate isomerase RpiA [Planctomycetota bacterium]
MDDTTPLKLKAAAAAVDLVASGMIVGLGHGSTASLAVRRLHQVMLAGRLENITGIPCSQQTETEARALDIPLATLEEHPAIDVTIDGADEVDPELNVIKGGGGALLREKIVAQASRREVIIVDPSKLSEKLGTRRAVPVEVIPFGWSDQKRFLESLGAKVTVRQDASGKPFVSDQGNLILDADFGPIADPAGLAAALKARTGIVEHGLFIGLATDVIVGKSAHRVQHLRRASGGPA